MIRHALAALLLASCSPGSPTPAPAVDSGPELPVYGYTVVATYPHDTAAFTEGLLYLDNVFYESTGVAGTSWIRKVDPATGKVLQQIDIDKKYFGEGIVNWQDKLVSLTWQGQKGFVWDLATFKPKGEWSYSGEGWALTTDGKQIIMSDGTSELRLIDPVTLKETGRIKVKVNGHPQDKLNELEFIKGEIWANVFESDRIVRIDPATGNITGTVYLGNILPAEERTSNTDVLNGIAYDAAGDRIFVTGKYWPKIYEIKLKDPAAPAKPG